MTSDPKLKRFFNWANRNWFGGELPDVEIIWEPCADASAKTSDIEPASEGEPPTLMIRVDPMMHGLWRHTQLDVAHECCHVKLWGYRKLADHGKRFDAEIQRLCGFRSYRKLL